METKFNFKSSVCTDKNQSERLLSLGLKLETADMCYFKKDIYGGKDVARTEIPEIWTRSFSEAYIPAWSLHRLIEMCPYYIEFGNKEWVLMVNHSDVQYKVTGGCSYVGSFIGADLYTNLIDCIEWLIKEGYLNKEYLV